jgi:hypothetical protein
MVAERRRGLAGLLLSFGACSQRENHLACGESAATSQSRTGAERKQCVKKFISEQWILSCKSLGRASVILVFRSRMRYNPL